MLASVRTMVLPDFTVDVRPVPHPGAPATQLQYVLFLQDGTRGALELVFPSASDLRGFLTHARTAFAQARRRARAQRVGDRARSTVYQARFL